ncbi:MAG: hypothetical protein LQ343_007448 [Gyalolechia ehrenbergii]|nr:MAG: hypothetical protein LQ343_007448 [Gyalolechia ehrenbergii]
MFPDPSTFVRVLRPRSKLHHHNTTGGTIPTRQADFTEDILGDPSPRSTAYDDTLSSPTTRRRKLLARDEYTAAVNPHHQSITLLAHGRPLPCNADNPLRALLRFSTEAVDFCAAYLATVFPNGHPLPTFVSQYNSAELSSACSCFELTIGCCTLPSGNAGQTFRAGATTTTQPHLSTVPGPPSSLPRTPRPSSSINPATEDSTFSRPLEYSGPPPTSEATITADRQGPTSVPLPSKSEYPVQHASS